MHNILVAREERCLLQNLGLQPSTLILGLFLPARPGITEDALAKGSEEGMRILSYAQRAKVLELPQYCMQQPGATVGEPEVEGDHQLQRSGPKTEQPSNSLGWSLSDRWSGKNTL